jgi:hypothetical protein
MILRRVSWSPVATIWISTPRKILQKRIYMRNSLSIQIIQVDPIKHIVISWTIILDDYREDRFH